MTEGEIRSMLREDRSRGEQALFEEYYSYGECAVIEGVSNFYN